MHATYGLLSLLLMSMTMRVSSKPPSLPKEEQVGTALRGASTPLEKTSRVLGSPQLHWRKDSLRLVYDTEKAAGKYRFVHSPSVIDDGDGIEHVYACHSPQVKQFNDCIYYASRQGEKEVGSMEAMYCGVRKNMGPPYVQTSNGTPLSDMLIGLPHAQWSPNSTALTDTAKNFGMDWGQPNNYYWNACEPGVLNKRVSYKGIAYDRIMFHTTMPIESFACIEGKKSGTCDDDSEYNDIGVMYFKGDGGQEKVPFQSLFKYNRAQPKPHPFEYGIGQPSIATFLEDETYMFYTYGDSVGDLGRFSVHFAQLKFDDDGPRMENDRQVHYDGIQDVFGNQVYAFSNVDVVYDQFRDQVYVITDLYPFPLHSRVAGAAQILAISRRGLLDASEPWRQIGVIWEDELYPKQMEVEYGVKVQKTHNAFETHLKRQHNSCFVKTGTGQLVDRNKLKIYFTSANDVPAQTCIDSKGSDCAEYSYNLYAIDATLSDG